jgi:hypothetical protein
MAKRTHAELLGAMHLFVCDGMEKDFYRYEGSGYTIEEINKLYSDNAEDTAYPDWRIEAYIMQSGEHGNLIKTYTLCDEGWSINLRKRI